MVRFENVGLRYGMGAEVLRDLSFAIEPARSSSSPAPRAPARPRCCGCCSCRCGRRAGWSRLFGHDVAHLDAGRARDAAPPRRPRVPGFPPARPPDHLRERGAAAARAGPHRGELPRRGDRAAALGRPRRPDVGAAAGAVGRREAARRHRARGDRAAANCCSPTSRPATSIPTLAQRLLRLFVELNRSGTSIVIATHDIALMDQYDARRLVLHEGQLHVLD